MARSIEDIKKIIAGLLSKANDKGVTEEESFSFLNKAQNLMAQYNLEKEEFSTEAEIEAEEESIDKTFLDTSYGHIKWRRILVGAVAELFFCRGFIYDYSEGKSKKYRFCFIGKEHNRAVAISMFQYLEKTVVRLSRNYSKETLKRYHFEQGCGHRLCSRIYTKIAAMKEPFKPENKTNSDNLEMSSKDRTNLPALYSNELTLVENYMNGIPVKASRKQRQLKANTASVAGFRAAEGINFNNQISGNNKNNKMIP
jgi:hypothetical protein